MNSTPATLERANAIQFALTKQAQGALSLNVNRTIHKKAVLAASDVSTENVVAPVYMIPADTGTGKTSFVCSLIASFAEVDPHYTAAYVVGTIDEAQRVYDNLTKHLAAHDLYLHTHAHSTKDSRVRAGYDLKVADHVEKHGTSAQCKLGSHRIIVCTHALWIKEGHKGSDFGIRRFQGTARRSNVFVDEQPECTVIEEATPSKVVFLIEQVERVADWGRALPVLSSVLKRMIETGGHEGAAYAPCSLLDRQEHAALADIDPALLNDPELGERMSQCLRFLDAASNGRSFIARGHHAGEAIGGVKRPTNFIAYRAQLNRHPGLIILDATASVAAFARLSSDVELAEVPPVRYPGLTLTNIEAPDAFKHIANRVPHAT